MALVVKNPTANAGSVKRHRFDPWVGEILWRRARQTTPVCLPGESLGQRSLASSSPFGHKESDTTGATEHAQKPVPQLLTVLLQPMKAQIAVS